MTDKRKPQIFHDEPPKKKKVEKETVTEHVETPVGNLVDLPSKGELGYPSEISYRDIMAGDEEILKTATNKNFSRTVNRVLKSICNEPSFFDDMYLGDRDYALTWIWANTYDDEKRFEVRCRSCGNQEETVVNIFKLDEIEIKENIRSQLPVTVNKTGETVKIRLATVRDENNAEKFLADNPKEEYSLDLVQMALAIDFDRPMDTKSRVEYFKTNISAKERGLIQEYHRYFQFGLDTRYEHTCSECQEVTRGSIPFLPEDVIAPEVRTDFEQLLRDAEGV